MEGFVIGLVIVVVIAVLFLFWYIAVLNMLRQTNVKCNEAESGIDVALTKRHDVLTKMFKVTKGYAKHERETLEAVIKMRQPAANAPMAEKSEYANQLSGALSRMNIVVEQYPELKADKSFGKLQDSISEVEEHLQAARRLYNSNISYLNQKIVTFPISMVASMAKISKRDFFEAEESKRQDVDMEF